MSTPTIVSGNDYFQSQTVEDADNFGDDSELLLQTSYADNTAYADPVVAEPVNHPVYAEPEQVYYGTWRPHPSEEPYGDNEGLICCTCFLLLMIVFIVTISALEYNNDDDYYDNHANETFYDKIRGKLRI
jgi:hypothetical protein